MAINVMRYRPNRDGSGAWLGNLERKIMDVAWAEGRPRTVRQVLYLMNNRGIVNERGEPYAYTSIMTTMERMAEKGMLTRQRVGLPYHYTPVCTEQEFIEMQARHVVAGLVELIGPGRVREFIAQVEA